MSMYYRENGEFYFPDYERPGRTKQSFKDSTDINRILRKAQKTGTISHLNRFGGEYGDYTDMPDLLTAQNRLARAKEIFDNLPSEVKRDFNQNPAEFFAFVNDPANVDRLEEILPQVAESGDYVPRVVRTAANMGGGASTTPPENVSVAPEGGSTETAETPTGEA